MQTHAGSPARTCCVCFTMSFSSPSVLKEIFQVKLTPHWHIWGWPVPPLRADLQNSALQRQNAIQMLSKLSWVSVICVVMDRFDSDSEKTHCRNWYQINVNSIKQLWCHFLRLVCFCLFRAKLNSKCSSHKIFTGEFVNSNSQNYQITKNKLLKHSFSKHSKPMLSSFNVIRKTLL